MSVETVNEESKEVKTGKTAENAMKSATFSHNQEPPWLQHARVFLNVKNVSSPGEFVNMMLKVCKLPQNPHKTFAISFMQYGKECDERVGAIIVFDSHVGFVENIDDKGVKVISCYNKKVKITKASEHGEILGYRRPESFAL